MGTGRTVEELSVYATHGAVASHFARVAKENGTGVALGDAACRLSDLLDWLVRAALPSVRVVSPPLRSLLMYRVVEQGDGAAALQPGRVRATADALDTCMRAGATAVDLQAAARTAKAGARARIGRLAEEMVRYEKLLAEAGVVDGSVAKWRAARALLDGAPLPTQLVLPVVIHVNAGPRLEACDVALLHALAARLSAPSELILTLPYRQGSPFFRTVARLIERLEAQGSAGAMTVLTPDPSDGDTAGARALFALHAPLPDVNTFSLLALGSPSEEAKAVAQVVRTAMASGTAPARIAVACRGDSARREGFIRALQDAGVPVAATNAVPLAGIPVVRWLRSVVTFAMEGGSRDDLAAILASDYGALWFAKGRVAADLVRRLSVRPSPGAWREELRAALGAWREGDDMSPEWPTLVDSARDAIAALADVCDRLRGAVGFAGAVAALRHLVTQSRVGEVTQLHGFPAPRLAELIVGGQGPIAAMDAHAVGRDEAGLDALDDLLATWAAAAAEAKVGVAWPFVTCMTVLDGAMGGASVSVGSLRASAVAVVDPSHVAAEAYDVVVLAALEDGVFPKVSATNTHLRPEDEWHIARTLARTWAFDVHDVGRDVVLTRSESEEATLFALAVAAAQQQVVFTRATADATGKNARPSPFMADLFTRDGSRAPATVESAPDLARARIAAASGVTGTREALVLAVAGLGAGASATAAARMPLPLVTSSLGVDDILLRAWRERARIAAMTDPDAGIADAWTGEADAVPAVATAETPLSVTALEDGAKCAFKYFAGRVLRLRTEAPGEDDPDQLTDGSIAHLCFEMAMNALIKAGHVPFSMGLADVARQIAYDVALPVANDRLSGLPLAPESVAYRAEHTARRVSNLMADLYAADDGYAPTATEWGFGEGTNPPLVIENGFGAPVALRGRVDLVELAGAKVRATDVKSGGASSLKARMKAERLGKSELQLFAYAAATLESFRGTESDARYVSLRGGDPIKSVREEVLSNRGSWKDSERTPEDLLAVHAADGALTDTARRVGRVVTSLRAGHFPVAPVEGACEYCDFSSVCRIPRDAPEREEE